MIRVPLAPRARHASTSCGNSAFYQANFGIYLMPGGQMYDPLHGVMVASGSHDAISLQPAYDTYDFSPILTRVGGLVQAAFSIPEIVIGIGLSEIGVGIPIALHGLDMGQAGVREMIYGEAVQTFTSLYVGAGLESAGLSHDNAQSYANWIDIGISTIDTLGGAALARAGARATAAGVERALINGGVRSVNRMGPAGAGDLIPGARAGEMLPQPTYPSGGVQGASTAAEEGFVNLASEARTNHILYGEGPGQGGHLWPGQPGKTPFPQDWSAARIMNEVSDIATDPSLQWIQQTGRPGAWFTKAGDPTRWYVIGQRGGIEIKVVLEPAGEGIITAHPN